MDQAQTAYQKRVVAITEEVGDRFGAIAMSLAPHALIRLSIGAQKDEDLIKHMAGIQLAFVCFLFNKGLIVLKDAPKDGAA